MSKGNNLQSLFCGILFCISVSALIIACLAFTKKGVGYERYADAVHSERVTHGCTRKARLEYCKGQPPCKTNADCPSQGEKCPKLGSSDCEGDPNCKWNNEKCTSRGNWAPNVCKCQSGSDIKCAIGGGSCYAQGYPYCVKGAKVPFVVCN